MRSKRRTTQRPLKKPPAPKRGSSPPREELFRFVTDRVEDLIAVLDLDGTLRYASPSYTKILGDSGIAPGSDAFLSIHPEDRPRVKNIFEETIRTNMEQQAEFRLLLPDGRTLYLDSHAFLVRHPSDAVSSVVVISRDVTKGKESENELRLFAHALSYMKDCFCLTDLNNNFLFVNPAFCEVYGYAEEELTGRHVSIIQSSNNPPDLAGRIQEGTLAGGWNGEVLNRRKDGSEITVELWTSLIRNELDQPVAFVGIARDCTARKRTEKEILLLQTMIQAINQTPDVQSALAAAIRRICEFTGWVMGQAWIPKPDGTVLECSSAWYKKNDDLHEFRKLNKDIVFTPGTGLPGRVWLEKKLVWVDHLDAEDGLMRKNFFKHAGLRSGLAIPVMAKQRVLAVIEFFMFEECLQDEAISNLVNALTLQLDSVLERKQAEEELQRSVSLLTSTLNSTGDGILVVDEKGKVVTFNNKFLELWQIPESLVAHHDDKRLLDFVLHQLIDPDGFLRRVRELYTKPDVDSYDIIEFKDGRVIERRSHPQRIAGKSVGRVWNFHDISEQRRSAKVQQAVYEIAEATDRTTTLDELFKEVHRIIGTIMPAENFYLALYDSESGLISFPYFVDEVDSPPPPGVPGKGLTGYVLRTGRSLLCDKKKDEELQAKGEVELVGVSSPIWLGVPLIIENTSIGVMAVQHYSDPNAYGERELKVLEFVSSQIAKAIDKKKAEEKILESEKKYRRLFEESSDGIFVSKPEGKLLDVNPAGVKLFGYSSKQEMLQTDIAHDLFVYPEVRETFKSLLAQQGYVTDFEYEVKTKSGERKIVLENASAVRDDDGAIVAYRGFVRDITERKKLEDQLRHAQKMESIGTLAGGIAHDFNNLLGIILGYASLLEREKLDAKKTAQSITTIKKAVERGASLVSQLLTFARKSESWFESINVNETVAELVRMLNQTFPKTISITARLEPDIPSIIADSSQLHQALLNLCVNSRDAILEKNTNGSETGSLVLETKIVSGEVLRQKFSEVSAKEYVVITVTDSGGGMSEETMRRIFEPFFTTKELGKGTGLGLSVVYGVVNNHHGFVDVKSDLGLGTTFFLYFPIQRKIVETVERSPEETGSVPTGNETVLIVEDEEMLLTLVQSLLTERGYAVLTAKDGQEGVEVFKQHQDEIACILTDMGLPKLGGWEMFKKMKELKPNVKVILASGYCEPKLRSEMVSEGAKDFIQKPYVSEEVLKRIREVIDDGA